MNRIKQLRQEQGMSQKDLANELGVVQSTISSWENEQFYPDQPCQMYLCYLFNCSIDYLMGLGADAKPGFRGWNPENEDSICEYLLKHFPKFVSRDAQEQEILEQRNQEWLMEHGTDEDPEERAEAMSAYLMDRWEESGRASTIEGLEINLMMESLDQKEREQLVRVARAMFPEAALF